ncbi:MAG: small multi-drug export protein [Candidatus Cloacimonetes bacterium]|nr:small multi-drug export protein [Candidatus Cloacimonadota bacterium]
MEEVKKFIPLFIILIILPNILFCEIEKGQEKQAKISEYLENKNFSKEVIIVALATLPIFELRLAIPFAINHPDYKMSWHKSFLLAIIGNFLPIPFILLILKYGVELLIRIPVLKKFFDWLFARTRKKGAVIQKYEELGLILFVMIPLPITGAWTGSVAAYLFGIKFVPSLICILIGICLAGVIVTILSLFGIWGAIIASTVLIVLFVIWIINNIKRRLIQQQEN